MQLLAPEQLASILVPYQHIYIAYSGGIDSHVLLHLCASINTCRERMTAVHVHHGLHAEADQWMAFCAEHAKKSKVTFLGLRADVNKEPGQSLEEVARIVRYQALQSRLKPGDALLVAQHREDQLESFLLQLFRGAGIQGLSAMPEKIPLGKGCMIRPFLDVSKQAIVAYAKHHRLEWIQDPSNLNNDFDRNYLRNEVIPLLKKRWPSLDKIVSRSAGHCAQAQGYLAHTAAQLYQQVINLDDKTLSLNRLQKLDKYQQRLVLRHWFDLAELRMPAAAVIERIFREVIAAGQNKVPKLQGKGYCIRRYRDRLYCLKQSTTIKQQEKIIWPSNETCLTLPGNGQLLTVHSQSGISSELWRTAKIWVAYRQGGECLRIPGRVGRHNLKKLFQEAAIPPWQRQIMPLIYINGSLAAVADKWISSDFNTHDSGGNFKFLWRTEELIF